MKNGLGTFSYDKKCQRIRQYVTVECQQSVTGTGWDSYLADSKIT